MEFREVLEKVKAGYDKAAAAQSSHNISAGIEALQQVATIISSAFGATDEVSADTSEDVEPSEADELADWLTLVSQVEEHIRESRLAIVSGSREQARDHLLKSVELVAEKLAIE